MKLEVATRLHDARMAGQEITDLTDGVSHEAFDQNRLLRLSVWKLLEILGEALRQAELLEPALVHSIPNLRRNIDTRNRITHGYDSIDFDLILTIARDEVPRVVDHLTAVLQDAPVSEPGNWVGA
jgi:uncharacterized protein with HEPN domain